MGSPSVFFLFFGKLSDVYSKRKKESLQRIRVLAILQLQIHTMEKQKADSNPQKPKKDSPQAGLADRLIMH